MLFHFLSQQLTFQKFHFRKNVRLKVYAGECEFPSDVNWLQLSTVSEDISPHMFQKHENFRDQNLRTDSFDLTFSTHFAIVQILFL